MPLTATESELNYARSWIGSSEPVDTFNERFDRLSIGAADRRAALDSAIEESMRAQLAAFAFDKPGSATLPGGISVSFANNAADGKKILDDFISNYSTGSKKAAKVSPFVRDRTR